MEFPSFVSSLFPQTQQPKDFSEQVGEVIKPTIDKSRQNFGEKF